MSLELDAILADTDEMLEVTVEIDSALRSDGTLRTWYFSTHMRSTGSTETPANTTFDPFLIPGGVLGPLSQSLTEDVMFSGLATNNPGTLTLLQANPVPDALSEMNDYVFAGYQARIKIGRASDLYAAFEIYRTVTISIDPSVQLTDSGLQATFPLQSALKRMIEENLIIKRHVGIPHCVKALTNTFTYSIPSNAAYDVKSFTVMIRFRPQSDFGGTGAGVGFLARRFAAATNRQFQVSHFHSTRATNPGKIQVDTSVAGVSKTLWLSPAAVLDGNWHVLILGVQDKTTAYVIFDREIVAEVDETVLTGSVDTPAQPITGSTLQNSSICDLRFFNYYIPPELAISFSDVRGNGDEIGCVGMWRFDDNAGGTANDYSATGNDATLTGTINTDYQWTYTDLGEPELAGSLYPLNVGNVLNAQAQLIDGVRERYRGNNDSNFWFQPGGILNLTVKSQGTVLTGGGVDYTTPSSGGDGVFNTTLEEAEPITYDLVSSGTIEYLFFPPYVAFDLLSNRTRIAGADILNVTPLLILCPWPSGYYTNTESTAQKALADILGQSGMHYREDNDGSIYFDMFLPPTGYGPYGEPCLDLRGGQGNRIEWGDIADITGSLTICSWVRLQVLDQTAYNWGLSEPNQGSMFVVTKGGLPGNYSVWFQAVGADAGKLKFRTAGTTLSTSIGVLGNDDWYFIATVFDDTANTSKIYIGKFGESLVEVASGANTGSQSTNSNDLMVGDSGARFPWLAVHHLHIWDVAKNQSQLEALMAIPPVGNEANLRFYAPINEGNGDPVDLVSSTSGAISIADPLEPNGALPQWCPKLVVDLDETPSVKLSDFHHTHPAVDITVKYNKNRHKMSNAEVDSGVSQNNRLTLTREGLDVRLDETTDFKDRFKNGKKIILDSPLTDLESAQKLLRVMSDRFGPDNYVGTLTFPSGLNISRIACGLQIGDEIGLVGTIPEQINTPRSFRVAAVSPNPLQLSTTVAIFG